MGVGRTALTLAAVVGIGWSAQACAPVSNSMAHVANMDAQVTAMRGDMSELREMHSDMRHAFKTMDDMSEDAHQVRQMAATLDRLDERMSALESIAEDIHGMRGDMAPIAELHAMREEMAQLREGLDELGAMRREAAAMNGRLGKAQVSLDRINTQLGTLDGRMAKLEPVGHLAEQGNLALDHGTLIAVAFGLLIVGAFVMQWRTQRLLQAMAAAKQAAPELAPARTADDVAADPQPELELEPPGSVAALKAAIKRASEAAIPLRANA